MTHHRSAAAISGALIATGLIGAGYFISQAALTLRAGERSVEVKGLAEREVPADLALWSLAYTATAPELAQLQQRLESDADRITLFLDERGFDDDEITRVPPEITDRDSFGSNYQGDRYQGQAVVLVRSDRVDAVRSARQQSDALIAANVTLNRNYEYPTEYLFTALDRIKPEMIAEATRDARAAAQQFAEDSGATVGAIRRARQGYFSIEDRDRLSPHIKRVRVVTTIEYFLDH